MIYLFCNVQNMHKNINKYFLATKEIFSFENRKKRFRLLISKVYISKNTQVNFYEEIPTPVTKRAFFFIGTSRLKLTLQRAHEFVV